MHAGSVRGTANDLLALEQAIVDRELIELVTGGLCDETRELAGDRVRKRHIPAATRNTGARYDASSAESVG
jgi:hypothetical protein